MKLHLHHYVTVTKWECSPDTVTTIKRCRCLKSKITRTWIINT